MREWQRNYVIKDYWLYTYFLSLFFSSIVYIFIVSHLIANELQYQEEKRKRKKNSQGSRFQANHQELPKKKKLSQRTNQGPPSQQHQGREEKKT